MYTSTYIIIIIIIFNNLLYNNYILNTVDLNNILTILHSDHFVISITSTQFQLFPFASIDTYQTIAYSKLVHLENTKSSTSYANNTKQPT